MEKSFMQQQEVYLGLGGNIGDSQAALTQAIEHISTLPGVDAFRASSLYLTAPVSSIPQGDYINAVCTFQTSDSPLVLWRELENIERSQGKKPKHKEEPRIIDIDILLFGTIEYAHAGLHIPHPRWQSRLFVLAPLLELTQSVTLPDGTRYDVHRAVTQFPKNETQWVKRLGEKTKG